MIQRAGAPEGWHLDKKVPISIILALLAQGAGGIWYLGRIEARVTQLEHDTQITIAQQHDRDERQDRAMTEALALLRADMRDLSAKLDRLIERASRKP